VRGGALRLHFGSTEDGSTEGGSTEGVSHARWTQDGTDAINTRVGHKQYASYRRADLFAGTRRRAVDGRFEIVYICGALVLGKSSPKLSQSLVWTSSWSKKNLLGRSQIQIPKLGKNVLGQGAVGNIFPSKSQILGFGTYFLCPMCSERHAWTLNTTETKCFPGVVQLQLHLYSQTDRLTPSFIATADLVLSLTQRWSRVKMAFRGLPHSLHQPVLYCTVLYVLRCRASVNDESCSVILNVLLGTQGVWNEAKNKGNQVERPRRGVALDGSPLMKIEGPDPNRKPLQGAGAETNDADFIKCF
jgi:hypothetical protein